MGDPTGVDVLVLAGDITMARHYEDLANVLKPLARKYRHILYAIAAASSAVTRSARAQLDDAERGPYLAPGPLAVSVMRFS